MLGVAEADLQLEGGFVRLNGAPGMRKPLAELVDANDRRSGASRWRVVASRAARVHRAHRRRGTERVRIHLPPAASQRRTPPRTGAKPFGIGSIDDGGIDGAAKKFAGYRWFESISLQQTVCLSPAAACEGREPGFPRGFGQLACQPVSRDSLGVSISRQPGAISLSGHIPVPRCGWSWRQA